VLQRLNANHNRAVNIFMSTWVATKGTQEKGHELTLDLVTDAMEAESDVWVACLVLHVRKRASIVTLNATISELSRTKWVQMMPFWTNSPQDLLDSIGILMMS
jgi:3-deoxy-D-manno-octulosonic-acid transferase